MDAPSSICAADHLESVLHELQAREGQHIADPKFGRLVLKHGLPGLPSYWEGRYVFKADNSLVTLRVVAQEGATEPSEEQRAFVTDLEARFPLFSAGALVLLKPAFAHYVGTQRNLKWMLDEFLLTGLTVPALPADPARFEFLFRCCTDPAKAFYVGFENLRATKIRVDET